VPLEVFTQTGDSVLTRGSKVYLDDESVNDSDGHVNMGYMTLKPCK